MKKILSILMILVLCIGIIIPVSATQSVNSEKQEYLVGFNGKVNRGLLTAFAVKDQAMLHEYIFMPTVLLELTEAQAKGLSKNPNIEYVELNAEVNLLSQSIPWGIERVQSPAVWEIGYKGTGVKVAILDTGIDNTHEDLAGNVKGGMSVFSDSSNSDPFFDGNGHGTHVAGIVAALDNHIGVVGVAPEAELYAVKVLNNSGSGTLAGIVQGVEWARLNGMDVINMSLGGAVGSTALKNACDAANNAGIVVVAAAANSGNQAGTGNNVGYPARYESVIAVAATNSDNARAPFSSTGNTIEIAAPGVGILSTLPNNSYASLNGTSMAAPHVAGVAALIRSARGDISNHQIRNAMNSTALPLGNPNYYGNGLVQGYDAVNLALTY
ncbi:S8 family peptidase [Alkaliphilus transvaalensis]|uniref:S8 family peptidase n=1 Tax=Alkaliphilus transvaalensis TaxID=114628 RepID=UPI0005566D37|nr:S8 family peptidase [Alkaliphilus transvaalensis]